jgi:hypothetical protein
VRSWFSLVAVLLLAGCSAANESDFCTLQSNCSGCGSCYAQCTCRTGNDAQCRETCSGTNGASQEEGKSAPAGAGPLASDITISEITVNQAVGIPIMKDGEAIEQRNAPVVAGRAALIRVHVVPDSRFSPRSIVARLVVDGAPDQTVTRKVSAASTDGNLGSTFNFSIPASEMTTYMQFFVELEEASGSSRGHVEGARWPTAYGAAMNAESTHGPFRIMLVPVVMNGRTPDTGASRVKTLHDGMMAMYPASDVEIAVHAPVSYPYGSVSADGTGWTQALHWVSTLRGSNSRVYYYAMITPAASMKQYCGKGCVDGLGDVPAPNDVASRNGIGIGYFPDGSGGHEVVLAMAHELGHALGRKHAPCAPAGESITGIDPNYPHAHASIGVFGFDLVHHQLENPDHYKDFMSYCDPGWVSDYTYAALFEREAYVNLNGYIISSSDPARAPGLFRVAIIEPDGTMHWTANERTTLPQYGEERDVQVLDDVGDAVGSVVGFFQPVADLPGGILYVRQDALGTGVKAIRALSLSRTALAL